MGLFRLEIPAGDYEGRILADCDTVRLTIPGVGTVQVPVDAVTSVAPPLPPEPPEDGAFWLDPSWQAEDDVWHRDDSGMAPGSKWYRLADKTAHGWEQVCKLTDPTQWQRMTVLPVDPELPYRVYDGPVQLDVLPVGDVVRIDLTEDEVCVSFEADLEHAPRVAAAILSAHAQARAASRQVREEL